MEMRRKRTSREREKNQRCHLALNEGKENADRNKLSDSSGPLRETDRREMVCTEVQEDVKQGADGWMERWRNRGPNTKENKSSEFPPMSAWKSCPQCYSFFPFVEFKSFTPLCPTHFFIIYSLPPLPMHLRADPMWSIDSPSFHSSETNLSVDWLSKVATLSFSGSMFFISHESAL